MAANTFTVVCTNTVCPAHGKEREIGLVHLGQHVYASPGRVICGHCPGFPTQAFDLMIVAWGDVRVEPPAAVPVDPPHEDVPLPRG